MRDVPISDTRHFDVTDRLLAEWRQALPLVPRYERFHRTVCLIANLLHTLAVLEDHDSRQRELDLEVGA